MSLTARLHSQNAQIKERKRFDLQNERRKAQTAVVARREYAKKLAQDARAAMPRGGREDLE